MGRKKQANSTENISITAIASDGEGATSGKIIITSGENKKDIAAVVFAPDKAESLLEVVDKVYLKE